MRTSLRRFGCNATSSLIRLRMIRSMPGYRGDAPVRLWILAIARNVCADHVRRRQRERRLIGRLTDLIEFSDASYGRPTLWLVLLTVATLIVLSRRSSSHPPNQ